MRAAILLSLLSTSLFASATSLPPRNYAANDYYAIHLDPSASPADFAAHLGLEYEGPLGSIAGHHVFKAPKTESDIVHDAVQELKRKRRKREVGEEHSPLDSIRYTQKAKIKPRLVKRAPPYIRSLQPYDSGDSDSSTQDALQNMQRELSKTLDIQDPIFSDQWHLLNTKRKGNDLNVTGVWLDGITGRNVTVCIVDDGLDMDSDDLKDNYYAAGSYDFNDKVDAPKPRLSDDRHGTRCAGEVAAGRNNACGVGVAYDSNISGVRILSGDISDIDEALAVNYEMQHNDIYSCSWGPPDDGRTMQGPGILIEKAMITAVQQGRGGKGSIYVFAAGNGAANDDNCNFDGYTNSIYSVTVGSIDRNNLHPYYSEACSAQLVVTYSSGSGDAIHTTDVGSNKCTSSHGGTSAAGPLAAGVYALALSARPDLTWRDIQWLTVLTAQPFDQPSDWQTTSIGKSFSHQFGYGKLDAYALIDKAKDWEPVKPQAWFFSPWIHVKTDIPEGNAGLASTFEVTEEQLKDANLERLEHITVTMNVEHTRRGDLSVELRSPNGIVSHLSTSRRNDEARSGYVDWTFMSVVHWGESPVGKWTVIVKDTKENGHKGTFTDWKLRLWGECRDAASQSLLPIPDGHEDDDHDVITTMPVHITSISVPTAPASADPNAPHPTEHPDRPVVQKPSDGAPVATPTKIGVPGEALTTQTAAPDADSSASPLPDSFLPSPFPTFGVSKATQIWIYGAMALILTFCAGLATYLFMARRKRLRNNPRDNYEFELLDDAEGEGREGDAGAGLMGGGKKRRSKRAGELYDAFAGESDEELFSDDEDEEGAGAGRYGDEKKYEAAGGGRYGDADDEGVSEKRRRGSGSGNGSGSEEGGHSSGSSAGRGR